MPSNIAITITADVADLVAKRAVMSAELKAATKDLNDLAKASKSGMTDELKAKMLEAATAVAKTRAELSQLNAEMNKLGREGNGAALANITGAFKSSVLEEGAAKLGALGAGLEALGPEGLAAAAGIAAVAYASEQALKGAEWAESLKKASATLGLTTTQLQEFDFAFNAMGIDVAKGRETLSALEKTIGQVTSGMARAQTLRAFQFIDVSPEQLKTWGALPDQIEGVVDALAKLNPEQRAAADAKLKVDPEVIQSLIDERDRLRDLIAEAHQYGVVIPADVIDKSAEAAGKMREWKAVIDGELRGAFIELAPLIAGTAKAVADGAKGFADIVRGARDTAAGFGDLVIGVNNFNQKADAALPLLGDLDRLLHSVGGGLDLGKGFAGGFGAALQQLLGPLGSVIGLLGQLRNSGAESRARDDKVNALHDQVMRDVGPKAPPAKTLPPTTKGGESQMTAWKNELSQAEYDTRASTGQWLADMSDFEVRFWQKKLATAKAGSATYGEAQKALDAAMLASKRQAAERTLADDKERIEAEKLNWAGSPELTPTRGLAPRLPPLP